MIFYRLVPIAFAALFAVFSVSCELLQTAPSDSCASAGTGVLFPEGARLPPGAEQLYSSQVGCGVTWSVSPSHMGTIETSSGSESRALFRAGFQPGEYTVTASSENGIESASGEVVAGNWMELVSFGVPQGGTIVVGSRAEAKVRYVTAQERTSLRVRFSGPNGEPINTNASGSAFLRSYGEDVFMVGPSLNLRDDPLPIEVEFIEIRMFDGDPPFDTYLTLKVPYRLSIVGGQ